MPKKLPTEMKTGLMRFLKDNDELDDHEEELAENLAGTDVTQPPSFN